MRKKVSLSNRNVGPKTQVKMPEEDKKYQKVFGTERDQTGVGYSTYNNDVNADDVKLEFPGTGETTNRQ